MKIVRTRHKSDQIRNFGPSSACERPHGGGGGNMTNTATTPKPKYIRNQSESKIDTTGASVTKDDIVSLSGEMGFSNNFDLLLGFATLILTHFYSWNILEK